ncbi:MAG: helix-turn-helix domain-containing protein [Nitrospira sp.]|nr:helix-turn-helix domain-containing protein [Nitrospira sp.]
MEQSQRELVSAKELEARGILSKATAYKMARAGKIPSYAIGTEGRGVRFRVEEVLSVLRRPAVSETAVQK